MRGICLGRTGLVEIFLYNLRTKIDEYVSENDFDMDVQLISSTKNFTLSVISMEWKRIRAILNIGLSLSFECERITFITNQN